MKSVFENTLIFKKSVNCSMTSRKVDQLKKVLFWTRIVQCKVIIKDFNLFQKFKEITLFRDLVYGIDEASVGKARRSSSIHFPRRNR